MARVTIASHEPESLAATSHYALPRPGAHAGDVLKITGGAIGVARAQSAFMKHAVRNQVINEG